LKAASLRAAALSPLAALTALVLLLFAGILSGDRVLFERDIYFVWHGQVDAFTRVVRAGSWPTWNPYHSFGQVLLANPNTQVFYPPTWLNLLMRPESYYSLYVVGHFVLSAAGFYLLCRRLALSPAAGLAAAAVWILGGPMLSLVQLWSHMAGAAWLPWVLLAADRAFASGRPSAALPWGLALTAQVLVGAPETLIATGLLSCGMALRHVHRGAGGWPLLRVALVAAAAGLAFSAMQWVPTIAAARATMRLSPPESVRTFWSIHPLQALEIGLPLELDRLPLPVEWRATAFESREAFLPSLYCGLPALGLAAAAVATGRRRPLLLLGVATAALLLALGRHTAFYDVAVTVLPFLRAFRYPAKAMIVVGFALALLSGIGLDACREPPGRGRLLGACLPVAAVVLACAALAFFAGSGSPLGAVLAPAGVRLAIAAASGALFVALRVVTRREGAGARAVAALALLAVVDLFAVHQDLNPTAPREVFALRPPALDLPPGAAWSRTYVFDYALPGRSERYLGHGGGFALAEGGDVPWRVVAAARTYPHPFMLGSFGIEGSYAADSILMYPPPLEALTHAVYNAEETPAEYRLLRAGAVARVVALHDRGFERLEPLATLPSLFREPVRVFAVPDPLPRTFAVGTVRVADGEAALRFLTDPARDLGAEAVAAEGPPLTAPAPFHATSSIALWKPDRVRLDVEASAPAMAVLVDTFERGWTVTVDGAPAQPRRVNLAFRGVVVPPGRHRVEWLYRPPDVVAGLCISGAALALAAGASLVRLRGRRAPPLA